MTGQVRTVDGRVAGRRGQATRQKLLDCLSEMLSSSPYRDVKVIDVARKAGTSPATFYQYFADVEQAVLVLAEELTPDSAALTDVVNRDWDGAAGLETARAVVEGFLDYYERHRPIFRVVDLATEEGDLRFHRLRVRALSGITQALTEAITAQKRAGNLRRDVDPTATAFVLVAMLAHCAAHRFGFEFWGVRTATTVDALTRIVHWSVTGRGEPAG